MSEIIENPLTENIAENQPVIETQPAGSVDPTPENEKAETLKDRVDKKPTGKQPKTPDKKLTKEEKEKLGIKQGGGAGTLNRKNRKERSTIDEKEAKKIIEGEDPEKKELTAKERKDIEESWLEMAELFVIGFDILQATIFSFILKDDRENYYFGKKETEMIAKPLNRIMIKQAEKGEHANPYFALFMALIMALGPSLILVAIHYNLLDKIMGRFTGKKHSNEPQPETEKVTDNDDYFDDSKIIQMKVNESATI